MIDKVCTKCQIELRPHKNGVIVVAMATFGPSEFYSADEWYCPLCGWKGIFGFGSVLASHCEPDFEDKLAKEEKKGRVIYRFWLNRIEKLSKCSKCDGTGWVAARRRGHIPPSTCLVCCGKGVHCEKQ